MSDRTPLDFERTTHGALMVLTLRGPLDLTTASALETRIDDEMREPLDGITTVVLDLGDLTFLDSAGIRTIDRAHRVLSSHGRRLVLVAPTESVAAWTLRITSLPEAVVLESIDLVGDLRS